MLQKTDKAACSFFPLPGEPLISPARCPALSLLSLTEPLCPVPSLWALGTGSTLPKKALWKYPVSKRKHPCKQYPCTFQTQSKGMEKARLNLDMEMNYIPLCVPVYQICYWLPGLALSVVLSCSSFLFFCASHEAIFFLLLQIPQVFLQVPMLIIFSEGSALLPLTWCRNLHSKMCTKSLFTQLCRYWCWLHFTSDVHIHMCVFKLPNVLTGISQLPSVGRRCFACSM